MKILQVGSKSVHVSSFISALKNIESEIYLLSEEPCEFEGVIKNYIISFRQLNPLQILKNNRAIKNLLEKLNPDVIHIHQVNRSAFFVARIAKKMNVRVVTTAWGSDVLLIPKKNFFFKHIVKKTLLNSDVVTADSQEMIESMKTLVNQDKYVLLQYGIDPIKSAAKEKIIYSNRLHEPLYRIDQIITYFAAFSKENPEWKLVIAGTGSETMKLQELTKNLELESKIKFVGWLQKEQNRSWYAKSFIYISIPQSDGTSVSVLEAMSAGCIPIVSDLPVSHEWIQSGINGIIENQEKNPLFEVLKMNQEDCALTNSKMIQEKATRNASLKKFIQLYR